MLGFYETAEQAALEYDDAASNLYGEFAWLNRDHFPELCFTKREYVSYKIPSKSNIVDVDEMASWIIQSNLTKTQKTVLIGTLKGKTFAESGLDIGKTRQMAEKVHKKAIYRMSCLAKKEHREFEQFVI